jgi:hypothetical protein
MVLKIFTIITSALLLVIPPSENKLISGTKKIPKAVGKEKKKKE